MAYNLDCYFFGVINPRRLGHHLYAGERVVNESYLPIDFPVHIRALDGGLLPPLLSQTEGRAELIHIKRWTLLTFWDRSSDQRGRSSSTFIMLGTHDFQTAVEIAKGHYPQVWERFNFDVFQYKIEAAEAQG